MVVSVSVGMPSATGQIIPLDADGVVQSEVTSDSFRAAILLQKPVALWEGSNILLHRTDLPPTQMRIVGSGEVVEIRDKIRLLRPRIRIGKVHRIREKDTLVEGLASNKEIASKLVNATVKTKEGVVGIIRQPFGTRGVVIVDFEHPVVENEEVSYQRLTEEEYIFGR
jgi:hypothetical protein